MAAGGGGDPVNIYNTDGSLTGNRILTLAAHSFTIESGRRRRLVHRIALDLFSPIERYGLYRRRRMSFSANSAGTPSFYA